MKNEIEAIGELPKVFIEYNECHFSPSETNVTNTIRIVSGETLYRRRILEEYTKGIKKKKKEEFENSKECHINIGGNLKGSYLIDSDKRSFIFKEEDHKLSPDRIMEKIKQDFIQEVLTPKICKEEKLFDIKRGNELIRFHNKISKWNLFELQEVEIMNADNRKTICKTKIQDHEGILEQQSKNVKCNSDYNKIYSNRYVVKIYPELKWRIITRYNPPVEINSRVIKKELIVTNKAIGNIELIKKAIQDNDKIFNKEEYLKDIERIEKNIRFINSKPMNFEEEVEELLGKVKKDLNVTVIDTKKAVNYFAKIV